MNLLPARIEGERLRMPMTTLRLPDALRASLPAGTETVIAGIRPEHFRIAEDDAADNDDAVLRIRADLVEWLGADVYLHFEVAAERPLTVTARIANETRAREVEGEEIALAIEPSGLLLFDADSGERIEADP